MLKPLCAAGMAALFLAPGARASVEPSTFDPSVRPQDDFFRYANGTWLRNNPVPPDYSRWASFDELQVRITEQLRGICEASAAKGAAGSPLERLVGDFYASGMDEAAADAAGASPIRPEL